MAATTSFFTTNGTATFPSQATAAQTRLYLGSAASNPTVDLAGNPLQSGMLYTRSTDDRLFYYDGSAWREASAATVGALTDVVADLTPELGGDLQSNGSDIVMAADDIVQLGTDPNTSSLLLHASAQNTTRFQSTNVSFMKRDGSDVAVEVRPGATKSLIAYAGTPRAEKFAVRGSGILVTGTMTSDEATIAGLAYPSADGTNGQVVTTDGAGALTLQDVPTGASVGSAIAFAIAL